VRVNLPLEEDHRVITIMIRIQAAARGNLPAEKNYFANRLKKIKFGIDIRTSFGNKSRNHAFNRNLLDIIATIPKTPMANPSNVIYTGNPGVDGVEEVAGWVIVNHSLIPIAFPLFMS